MFKEIIGAKPLSLTYIVGKFLDAQRKTKNIKFELIDNTLLLLFQLISTYISNAIVVVIYLLFSS